MSVSVWPSFPPAQVHPHTHTRSHIHTHTRSHIHSHTRSGTPTYTHLHIHSHTHSHTHALFDAAAVPFGVETRRRKQLQPCVRQPLLQAAPAKKAYTLAPVACSRRSHRSACCPHQARPASPEQVGPPLLCLPLLLLRQREQPHRCWNEPRSSAAMAWVVVAEAVVAEAVVAEQGQHLLQWGCWYSCYCCCCCCCCCCYFVYCGVLQTCWRCLYSS